jgi:hypothetical protein
MRCRRIIVVSPPTLQNSGLQSYAHALSAALVDICEDVEHVTYIEGFSLPELTQSTLLVWVGLPADPSLANKLLDEIRSISRQVPQLLLPEWEGHSCEESFKMVAPVLGGVYVLLPENQRVQSIFSSSIAMRRAYVLPTPVAAAAFESFGGAGGRDLSAMYLGRVSRQKAVLDLARFWSSSSLSKLVPLHLYVPDTAQSIESYAGVSFYHLPPEPYTQRFRIYRNHTFYVSASKYEFSPIVPVEAMAQGCIALLSDIPGHRELGRKVRSARLFKDLSGLEAAIHEVLSSTVAMHAAATTTRSASARSHTPILTTHNHTHNIRLI